LERQTNRDEKEEPSHDAKKIANCNIKEHKEIWKVSPISESRKRRLVTYNTEKVIKFEYRKQYNRSVVEAYIKNCTLKQKSIGSAFTSDVSPTLF